MSFVVAMPKLSPTMERGTVVRWYAKEGDFLQAEALLLEVATDKATIEHHLLDAGFLRAILVQEGCEAEVSEPIALFSSSLQDLVDPLLYKKKENPSKELQTSSPTISAVERVKSAPLEHPFPLQKTGFSPFGIVEKLKKREDFGLKASPYARKLAREKGVALATVQGSGPGGRVVAKDVASAETPNRWRIDFGKKEEPTEKAGAFAYEKRSPMQEAVGDRLQEAKSFIPHFYMTLCLDATALTVLQKQLKAEGFSITLNDLIVRASALALRCHPQVNSGFDMRENRIIRFHTIDICIAVSLEKGLITPVLYQADYKGIGEISKETKTLVARAKEGKLEPYEYKGGSFTISNLGMFGVERFTAILNPPQAAILAVGAIQEKAMVKEGVLFAGKSLELTLSLDHRVLSGAEGALFLQELKRLLESPSLLLL